MFEVIPFIPVKLNILLKAGKQQTPFPARFRKGRFRCEGEAVGQLEQFQRAEEIGDFEGCGFRGV